ncbi:ribonuclease D [Botrimarina hoheduenensis]|uniref:Ribonuclease D n=1 Tax=Botrimarina hoheduenensis TaxID=2528000 RepID=A0A5C5WC53_9BACT|nr:HRDC domain-containing protein [Botrimarina hoheduenensis]TWT48496.1 Ribonuclease D [Botrimarina hoheduenensis]
MSYEAVLTDSDLASLCARLAGSKRIGFDTEFVSEDTFRPELCLVQVIGDDGLPAVIDPQGIDDMTPFWRLLAEGDHITIVHAAREELNFCHTAIGRAPANVFDTQLAAGLCSAEYPAAYSSVVQRFLGKRPSKGEQRTDWRRRPLTDAQIDYALEDVRYLFALHDKIIARLEQHGRIDWLATEMDGFLTEVDDSRTRQRWRKVSGIGALPLRSLAVVREVWQWRQLEAERRDLPPRRVLRDDLIVELAKKKSDREDKIRSIRGMLHGQLKKSIPDIALAVRRGLEASTDDLQGPRRKPPPPQLNLLGQVIAPAITSLCNRAEIAASLACTATDIRELISYRLGFSGEGEDPPALASGWRAELIGNLIDDLLAGKRAIRISDPNCEQPLEFTSL